MRNYTIRSFIALSISIMAMTLMWLMLTIPANSHSIVLAAPMARLTHPLAAS